MAAESSFEDLVQQRGATVRFPVKIMRQRRPFSLSLSKRTCSRNLCVLASPPPQKCRRRQV